MAPLVVVRSSKSVGTARVQQIIQGFLESAETVEQALDLTVTNRERLCVTAPDIIGKLKVLVKEVKESSTTRHGSRTSGKPAQGPKKAGSQPTAISGSNSVNKKKRPHDDIEADESKILANNKEKKNKKVKKERKES